MPYLNIDDGIDEHPKVDALSDAAYRLLFRDICEWSRTGRADNPFVQWLLDEKLIRRAPRHWLPEWLQGSAKRYRLKIPAAVRQTVYERDGLACRRCGTPDDLTLDHVIPWSAGGSDDASNLQTLCRSCNARKGARL
jgi:hypothetical protein